MITTIEMAQSPLLAERERAITKTIENAVMLAKDPEWEKLRVYSIAEEVIQSFGLSGDEYEAAIKSLTEALKI